MRGLQVDVPKPEMQSIPPLEALCCDCLRQTLCPASVCPALELVDHLSPALEPLEAALISYLAQNLDVVVADEREAFGRLPITALALLLKNCNLVRPWLRKRKGGR
jgi:hypothetical protein